MLQVTDTSAEASFQYFQLLVFEVFKCSRLNWMHLVKLWLFKPFEKLASELLLEAEFAWKH